MRSIVNITKLSIAGLILSLGISSAMANTLSEVEVHPQGNGYGVVLKTESIPQMKKIVSANDRMAIILKDVNVSDDINTVYNNVSDLDNVTVQPASKRDIKIVFKGKNVANSHVSFQTSGNSSFSSILPVETLQLNKPVSSYAPVYSEEDFVDEEAAVVSQTSNPQLNELLTKMHITREMLVSAKKYVKAAVRKANAVTGMDSSNLLTVIGILFIAGVLILKPRKNNKQEVAVRNTERPIGLPSRANLEREIDINRTMANSMKLGGVANAAKAGYGMRAYQQSQRNPYTTSNTMSNGISGIARRPVAQSIPVKKQALDAKPVTRESAPIKQNKVLAQRLAETKKVTKPAIQTTFTSSKVSAPAVPSGDLDSMKFLESITKIYENSGRADLAKGLKDNLKKAQMSQL